MKCCIERLQLQLLGRHFLISLHFLLFLIQTVAMDLLLLHPPAQIQLLPTHPSHLSQVATWSAQLTSSTGVFDISVPLDVKECCRVSWRPAYLLLLLLLNRHWTLIVLSQNQGPVIHPDPQIWTPIAHVWRMAVFAMCVV